MSGEWFDYPEAIQQKITDAYEGDWDTPGDVGRPHKVTVYPRRGIQINKTSKFERPVRYYVDQPLEVKTEVQVPSAVGAEILEQAPPPPAERPAVVKQEPAEEAGEEVPGPSLVLHEGTARRRSKANKIRREDTVPLRDRKGQVQEGVTVKIESDAQALVMQTVSYTHLTLPTICSV